MDSSLQRRPTGLSLRRTSYRTEIVSLAKPAVVEGRVSFEQASNAIQALFAEHASSAKVTTEIGQAYGSLDGLTRRRALLRQCRGPARSVLRGPAGDLSERQGCGGGRRGGTELLGFPLDPASHQLSASERHRPGFGGHGGGRAGHGALAGFGHSCSPANPATGERSEIIVNSSFGLGEAVVSGQVTPDTFIVDRETLNAKETVIGPKAQQIVADGDQGTRLADVDEDSRSLSSLTDDMLRELCATAIDIEKLYGGVPQDIEWAIVGDELVPASIASHYQPAGAAHRSQSGNPRRRQESSTGARSSKTCRTRSVRCSRSYT